MANYQEARVQLTNTQLSKLKSAAKIKTGTILRLNKKNFADEELTHELLLATGETTKIRNAFANNMSTDLKLSKAQISKIVQSDGSFGSWLGNLGKKALTNIAIPLARDKLLSKQLVSNLASNANVSEKVGVRAGKGSILFISNEDMNDIIKIIKSLGDLAVLIDGVTKAVKHKIKKQEGQFLGVLLAPLASSLVQPAVISSVVKSISARGASRAGRGYVDKVF